MQFLPFEMYGVRVYAGFWQRLVALLIDFLVYVPVILLYHYSFTTSITLYIVWLIISTLFPIIYTVFFHYKFGATIGKLAVGIKVTQPDGSKISFRQAVLRSLVDILFEIIFALVAFYTLSSMDLAYLASLPQDFTTRLNYESSFSPSWQQPLDIISSIWVCSEVIVMLFNKRKRALHDFIAGTVVINKELTKESLKSYAMRNTL